MAESGPAGALGAAFANSADGVYKLLCAATLRSGWGSISNHAGRFPMNKLSQTFARTVTAGGVFAIVLAASAISAPQAEARGIEGAWVWRRHRGVFGRTSRARRMPGALLPIRARGFAERNVRDGVGKC